MGIHMSSEGLRLVAEAISAGTKLELHSDGAIERILCSTCCTESAGRAKFLGFAEDGIRELGVITACLNPDCEDGVKR